MTQFTVPFTHDAEGSYLALDTINPEGETLHCVRLTPTAEMRGLNLRAPNGKVTAASKREPLITWGPRCFLEMPHAWRIAFERAKAWRYSKNAMFFGSTIKVRIESIEARLGPSHALRLIAVNIENWQPTDEAMAALDAHIAEIKMWFN